MMHSPCVPAGAFIAAILVLVPIPSHWRARNAATLSLISWLFVVDIIYGVNATVWSDNAEVRLLVWCDITTKIIIGASSALPAATMCICKHLELVSSGRVVRLTNEDKRRRTIFELVMCFGVPMILMALHYIVQGHRFDIVEAIGCQPATYYSIPAVFIVWFPPLVLSMITLIYASLALYHFVRRRVTFAMHLQNSNSALTTGRYIRLIAMSIIEILWGTSLNALAMYDNISPGLRPWTSWNDVHSNFSRIGQYALVQFPPAYLRQMFLFEWAIPTSSYIFFIFFGFGEESIKDYSRVFTWLRRRVFRQRVSQPPVLPIRRSLPTRFDTLDAFDSNNLIESKDDQTTSYMYSMDEKTASAAAFESIENLDSRETIRHGLDDPSPLITPSTALSSESTYQPVLRDLGSPPHSPALIAAASHMLVPPPAYCRPLSPSMLVTPILEDHSQLQDKPVLEAASNEV
ncbi:hypothetical protein AcV7_010118 [Taiwanofungus camphoratus]|nr:hypothetical protein AcV7_010118 [Antrodia cinnamomea]